MASDDSIKYDKYVLNLVNADGGMFTTLIGGDFDLQKDDFVIWSCKPRWMAHLRLHHFPIADFRGVQQWEFDVAA